MRSYSKVVFDGDGVTMSTGSVIATATDETIIELARTTVTKGTLGLVLTAHDTDHYRVVYSDSTATPTTKVGDLLTVFELMDIISEDMG